MTLNRVPVQPAVLRWARETASLDIPTAAKRLGVKPERIDQWEAGDGSPTIGQVRKMADVYARPLAALFLPEPLGEDVRRELPDFRTQQMRVQVVSRPLQKAIMRAYRQRDALRAVADELGLPEAELRPEFSLDQTQDPEHLGRSVRELLRIDSIPRATVTQPEAFLRELVRRTEQLRVTVIQVQRVPMTEMRGFSLGDGSCPVLALNGADWPRGKIYTLLHEFAHVGFRTNGLCDLHRSKDLARLERLCDQVAASALMPGPNFASALAALGTADVTIDIARTIGQEFGVSGESALLRMIELGRASWTDYWRLKPGFDAAYATHKNDEKHRNAGRDSPIYYQVKRRDLGRRFINQMVAAHEEDALSSRDLAQLLEVTYDKIPKLVGAEDNS